MLAMRQRATKPKARHRARSTKLKRLSLRPERARQIYSNGLLPSKKVGEAQTREAVDAFSRAVQYPKPGLGFNARAGFPAARLSRGSRCDVLPAREGSDAFP